MRTAAKALAWTVGGFVAAALLLYAAMFAVNLRDEPPSAAVQAFADLRAGLPAVPDDANAYVYLMGMQADAADDAYEVGLRRVTVFRGGGDWQDDPARGGYTRTRPAAAQAFVDACGRDEPQCVSAFAAAAVLAAEWSAEEPVLLPRYIRLLEHRAWREEFSGDVSHPLPSYTATMDGQRLLYLEAYALAENGDVEAAGELLAADVRFWRMVLESSDLVITKMIATAALTRAFTFGNLVLRSLDPGAASAAIPAEWREPLSDAERSMRRIMADEYLFVSWTLANGFSEAVPADTWHARLEARLLAPFYQPQDTLNRFADHYSELAEIFAAPLAEYPAAMARAEALSRGVAEAAFEGPLYNPLGDALVSGVSDFTGYAARVADLEGVRRAALAAAELRAAGEAAGDPALLLAASELESPYDGRPLEWDASVGAVVFRGLEPGDRGRHRLYR